MNTKFLTNIPFSSFGGYLLVLATLQAATNSRKQTWLIWLIFRKWHRTLDTGFLIFSLYIAYYKPNTRHLLLPDFTWPPWRFIKDPQISYKIISGSQHETILMMQLVNYVSRSFLWLMSGAQGQTAFCLILWLNGFHVPSFYCGFVNPSYLSPFNSR